MKDLAHLKAIRTKLEPTGYTCDLVFAQSTSSQYLILSSPSWGDAEERSVSTIDSNASMDVRVKAVTGTPDGVATMLANVRAILSPNHSPTLVPLAGWVLSIRFLRSEFIDVDQSTTNTNNRHPAQGVDTYRLTAEPIPT